MKIGEYEIRQGKVTLWFRNADMDFTITIDTDQARQMAEVMAIVANNLDEDYLHGIA